MVSERDAKLSNTLLAGWLLGIAGIASGLAYMSTEFGSDLPMWLFAPLPYILGACALIAGAIELNQVRRVRPVAGVFGIGLASIAVVPFFWGFVLVVVLIAIVAAMADPTG